MVSIYPFIFDLEDIFERASIFLPEAVDALGGVEVKRVQMRVIIRPIDDILVYFVTEVTLLLDKLTGLWFDRWIDSAGKS